jgi:hypothetical protein
LFGLFCLLSCCIALASGLPFLAGQSIVSGSRPAARSDLRACIFVDIYKLALQRTRSQFHGHNSLAPLRDMRRITRPIGRSCALRALFDTVRREDCARREQSPNSGQQHVIAENVFRNVLDS